MWIKSLKLENFQKHSDLQINFVDGVNVLYGRSDAGKSCIRRAIEWITQNESFDGIRKVNTKKTSVSIKLDNDIEIERVRSQSINRYIIREGEDEQVFDAVGKKIPDEVKEALSIYPIEVDGEEIYLNSHAQIALPFLFDKSPSFRMKLFNKLTGNDVLDQLFSQFNKDIFRVKRNLKEETEISEKREAELKSKKTEKEKAEVIHNRLKIRIENLKKLSEKYSNLLELKNLREANKEYKSEVSEKLKHINFPQLSLIKGLTEKIDRFQQYFTHKNALEKVKLGINRVTDQLKDLKPLSLDSDTLRAKIDRFERIEVIYEKFSQNQALLSENRINLKILEKDIGHNNKELKKYKICPECKGSGIVGDKL